MKLTLNRVGVTVNMQAEGSPEELALYSKLAGLLEADDVPEADPVVEEPVRHRPTGSSLFVQPHRIGTREQQS